MEISIGSVVYAGAGRETGGLFLVVGIEDDYVLIADGKRRRIEAPKRKKQKHVIPTDMIPEETLAAGGTISNPQARKILAKYRMQLEGGFFFGKG